eukprot:CAMPEP_0201639542 /NCGR_PEP_ID=MMETSP0493-20130528/19652_1 /ASSEMBLY_ACC=CAM_ASM_000838 /TAXON_ID=420259 /ORGANISM="Thalassiosira gravida, Strain GMp14c1" /LENGTH=355 /DNA_ID=CAMNT_0048112973 /DNA_START=25 /DNA_END=1094 /DNA_ORIENTATION=-
MSTLGSIITHGTSGQAKIRPKSSDISTITELSAIDQLRKENDRLREELENASQLSSRVSTVYTETLKIENHRLREELEASSSKVSANATQHVRNPNETMSKSTLENLLERDNMKDTSKHRRRTATRQEAITDFDHLPPVAHLINGVDFDDDSITTYSVIGNDVRQVVFERGGRESPDLLKKACSRIANTTRTVADQVKTVARDLNEERRMNGSICSAPLVRPLECFTACARRSKSETESMTYRHGSIQARKGRKGEAMPAEWKCQASHHTLPASANGQPLERSLDDSEKPKRDEQGTSPVDGRTVMEESRYRMPSGNMTVMMGEYFFHSSVLAFLEARDALAYSSTCRKAWTRGV